MEPCLFRHGKTGNYHDLLIVGTASMEPCLFRHGKEIDAAVFHFELDELQWSHVFSDMVSDAVHVEEPEPAPLQWSHVFSDMVRARSLY